MPVNLDDNGVFSVDLTLSDVQIGMLEEVTHLRIKDANNNEIGEKQLLTSVPFALVAGSVVGGVGGDFWDRPSSMAMLMA